MINWKAHPFLRLLLPLVIGILIGNYVRLVPSWYALAAPILFIPILVRFVKWPVAYRHRELYGLIANSFFVLSGFLLVSFYPETIKKDHFSNFLESDVYLEGIVSKPPTKKSRTNAILTISKITNKKEVTKTSGRLYVSFPDSTNIQYGQKIILKGTPRPFQLSSNPYAFSFKNWQYYQNIHYQLFAKPGSWHTVAYDQGSAFLGFTYGLRTNLQSVLHKIIPNKRDLGVASALVLGIKDDLSPETKDAFSKTGAMHVLAVSGLHVGIVSMGLRWLMALLIGKAKARRWWRLIGQLLGVWFFISLTGMGASAMRAGLMFSIIELGLALDRQSYIFNSIAASAFFLLLWNPFLLFQVGFQLSYLALSGIVFFQPFIYRLMAFESSFIDFIWKLTSVSIAAQMTTFPIAIYYFHHFPLSFILSGMVVVPAATILLPFTLFVFLINFISTSIASLLGQVLAFLYHWNTEFIFQLSQFKWLQITNIYFSPLTVICSFALIISFGIWFASAKKQLIFYVLGFLTIILVKHNIIQYQQANQSQIAFFKIAKTDALGFIAGNQIWRYTPDSLPVKKWNYATSALFIKEGIRHDTPIEAGYKNINIGLINHDNFWLFQGKTIRIIPPISHPTFSTNITFIKENIDTLELVDLQSDTVIIGNNISYYHSQQLQQFFERRAVFVHNIKQEGGLLLAQ